MSQLMSERVRLRVFEKEDIDLVLKWFNDPEVTQYLQFYLPLTRLFETQWYEKIALSENDAVFIIEALLKKGDYISIGTCGLHGIQWKDGVATVGIAIGKKDFWSNGYGSEAFRLLVDYGFNCLNLHRINSSVYDFNERSSKMQLRLGFQVEGRRRQAIFKNGRYVDEIILGILREEWMH